MWGKFAKDKWDINGCIVDHSGGERKNHERGEQIDEEANKKQT